MRGFKGGRARVGVFVLVLAFLPTLMGAAVPGEHTPMPTWSGIRAAFVEAVDRLTGKTPPKATVPAQASGSVPGRQRPVPAAVTRAIARAEGYRPAGDRGSSRRTPSRPPR